MLKRYFKNYRYRLGPIALYLLVLISMIVLFVCLSKTNFVKAISIQHSYNSSSFRYGYVLNYSIGDCSEVIYSDADIVFYKDSQRHYKLVATSIMEPENSCDKKIGPYNFSLIETYQEAIIPRNVAVLYDLQVGDEIFCEYSYTTELISTKIVEICNDFYDLNSNSIQNDVGMIALGFNPNYVNNTICKYVILSAESKTAEIAEFPQLLSGTFNKIDFINKAQKIIIIPIAILVLIIVFLYALYLVMIGRRTVHDLKILFYNGLTRSSFRFALIIEGIILYLIPSISVCLIMFGIFEVIEKTVGILLSAFTAIQLLAILLFTLSRTRGGRVNENIRCC